MNDSSETEDDDRLESTQESAIEDEATYAVTGKYRAHAPGRASDAPPPPPGFDSLKRTAPRNPSLRNAAPTPVPPDPSGLSGAPISMGRPPVSARPASVPPRPRLASVPPLPSPVSTGPAALSVPPRPRTPSVIALEETWRPESSAPVPPAADTAPDQTAPALTPSLAREPDGVPDDAPTVPGSFGGSLDDADFDAPHTDGPPGIPLLLAGPDLDNLDDRRRKAGRRRNTNRKGKRPTVRIPVDAVHEGETSAVEPLEPLDADDLDDETTHVAAPEAPPPAPAGGPASSSHVPASVSAFDRAILEPRPSAPIITDTQAIAMVRPIEIVSDMPPVPSASRPGVAATEEEIEEIEPERMSLPGDIISAARRAEAPKPPPLPPARTGSTAPAPPSSPGAARPPVAEPRLAIPGPLPVPMAPPSAPAAAASPASEAPARSLPKAPPPSTDFTPGRPREKRPWFSELFEDEMVRTLDNPKLKDVERETRFIEQSFRLPQGARLLDVACGHGVHAVELAGRGYQVVAVDFSTTLLGLARTYNERRGQSVSFVQGDMRQIELDGAFDGIYSWSASFGYFDDAANLNVLERLVRALRPGGKLLLDLTNRDYVAPRTPSTAWFEKPGCVCMDEVRFDYMSSRLHAKRMVIFENGRAREVEYSVRLYTANELVGLLESVGLQVLELSGHRAHRGAYFGNESPRLIALAQKT
ncbi:MAG: methyltransferase domain-containing protein [Deltaproteobacteria bacterium]|nr:methyltransferase domain-containing protein [Deltaproteobacteria bacterium]